MDHGTTDPSGTGSSTACNTTATMLLGQQLQDTTRAPVNRPQSTRSIVDFIVSRDLTDIVLLGHSYGGTIISKVVEVIPERVRRLVFWNGFVLNDGESLLSAVPPHYRALFGQLAEASPDNSVMLPFSIWREAFINDADLDGARASYEQLSPEPYQQMTEPLDLRKFYTLDTPRSYLNGTEDIALPPGEWGWHPRMSRRLGLYRLVQMPGSPRGYLLRSKRPGRQDY